MINTLRNSKDSSDVLKTYMAITLPLGPHIRPRFHNLEQSHGQAGSRPSHQCMESSTFPATHDDQRIREDTDVSTAVHMLWHIQWCTTPGDPELDCPVIGHGTAWHHRDGILISGCDPPQAWQAIFRSLVPLLAMGDGGYITQPKRQMSSVLGDGAWEPRSPIQVTSYA